MKKLKKLIFSAAAIFFPVLLTATNYYVDSKSGNDGNSGTVSGKPWKTLEKVNGAQFLPGDKIYFARGAEWTGELTITRDGTKMSPVTYTAYGKGVDPVIKNPGRRTICIRINSDWNIVENFRVFDCGDGGINISKGAEHNIVRNNEAEKTGIGIAVRGAYNLVTHNYAHDLIMVVNDPGGDNDYGAVGIWLFASGNEVSYNRLINCKAPSLDYGFDGGVVEFYGNVDSCYVHHNWGENCNGTFEVGGKSSFVNDITIAYNICINNGNAGGFHVGGKFGVKIKNFRIENNVFFETSPASYSIGFWNGTPDPDAFIYKNNIFYVPNHKRISTQPGFIHENNLYYLGGRTDAGIEFGKGEKIGDPLFVNIDKKDFHLQKGSPAIDSGQDIGYTEDFERKKVPAGKATDIGCYEFDRK